MQKQTVTVIFVLAFSVIADIAAADINALIRPYSTQRIVELDVEESVTFTLKNGRQRVIRLLSVQEQRDPVVNLVRSARVRVDIDGTPLDLLCEPYRMPTEWQDLRLQADATSGFGRIAKRLQLSLWDAGDPIVSTDRFRFPLPDYRLFSHGTQAYNEPVHLGAGDDDPEGQKFYHDYGFDIAGFESKESVVSAIEGEVVYFWPGREDLCSVVVQDRNGFVLEYAHLSAVEPNILLNTRVTAGQKLGTLGKTGPSGNFSHLHLGSYLQLSDALPKPGDPDIPNRRLNFYPWLVTAYQAQHPEGLLAVARPHHLALTGDTVVFDGSKSLAWGGSNIARYRWEFTDGQTVENSRAEKVFDRPGSYVAALRVWDDRGREDVDFCQVKVFSKDDPEKHMPHIFMTYTPTEKIQPNQPVCFRFWMQGSDNSPIQVIFDDGVQPDKYTPYSELTHAFKTGGLHIVTACSRVDGKPITQKLKVAVTSPLPNSR